ncbi:HTH domain-containing protein, partial [Staphylococcus aureus]|nr:HTH domain-containing protein [Staphylococcus aureus]
KGARAIQEINDPEGNWRNQEGRPSKENLVKEYIAENPDHTPTEIAKNLKISRTTVYKYI